jgi:PAS domain S-box-containing protein
MQSSDNSASKSVHINLLQDFAGFILKNHLVEFNRLIVSASKAEALPVLQYFKNLTDEQIHELSLKSNEEWLHALAENKGIEHVMLTLQRWTENHYPAVQKQHVEVEDIILTSKIRKAAFVQYISYYTNDLSKAIHLIQQIDDYIHLYSSTMLKTFIHLLQQRVADQALMNQKITETLPGIVYIFDKIKQKEVYTNRRFTERLGYDEADLRTMGQELVQNLVHPEDLLNVSRHMESLFNVKDGETRTVEYRARAKNGSYRWYRTHDAVFKRTEDGRVAQTIGIAFDIQEEKAIGERLQQREAQLIEAQELAQMGSYEWDITLNTYEITEQLYTLLELRQGDHFLGFMEKVHRDDKERVNNVLKNAVQNLENLDFEFRYLGRTGEKVFWSRGAVTKRHERKILKGTIIDVTQRHQIINQLKSSEELYKQAQAITHIGNYVWDLRQNKLSWSEELYRIYGLKPGDDIGSERIVSFNHPDDKDRVRKLIQKCIETLEPFDFTYRIVLSDGAVKILQARGELKADPESGKAAYMIGTAQDITAQQQLLEDFKKSEQLYKQAQALAHIGNWEWDVASNKVTWTDELYRIFGLEPQSLNITFENFLTLVHPDDIELVRKETFKSLETRVPNEFYHRTYPSAGGYRILHAKSEPVITDGKVVRLVGTAQDVTVQKLTEQKLREHQTFIEKITNATPCLIASYNIKTGQYIYVSEGLNKLLGYDAADALRDGLAFFVSIIHPDDLPLIAAKNQAALEKANASVPAQEAVEEFQYRLRHRDGNYRWIHTFGTVFSRDNENKVEYILNVSLDISERIKAEEILHQRTLELQRSNANLEEFAFVASHDLKEPLRKISIFTDRLLANEKQRLSGGGIEYVQKIMASALRMQDMVNDLLSLSTINSDKIFRRVSLLQLLNEAVTVLEYKIEEKGATVKCEHLPEANVIPSQIRQLFQNLLSNSLKFSKPERKPVITVRHEIVTKEHRESPANFIKIVFEDNGIGFDNTHAEQIFAIFARLHNKKVYEGTGIGLAICKKIIENHKGTITASGQCDMGATFTIELPN